jgi:hypothetical protein
MAIKMFSGIRTSDRIFVGATLVVALGLAAPGRDEPCPYGCVFENKNAGSCQHLLGGVNRPAVHLALNCKWICMGMTISETVNMALFYYKYRNFMKMQRKFRQ